MPEPITMIILGKMFLTKFAIKGGIAASSKLLQQLADDPHFQDLLGQVATKFGQEAAKEIVDNLSETVETVGELMEGLAELA